MAAANLVITSEQYDLSTPTIKFLVKMERTVKNRYSRFRLLPLQQIRPIYGSQYASVQGVRGTGAWNLGWGFNTPSTNLEAAYETGDPRKARTIFYAGGTSIHGELFHQDYLIRVIIIRFTATPQ